MQQDVHEHIRGWLDASIRGRLSGAQRRCLREHLAECPECLRAACDPEFLEESQDIVSRRHPPRPGFEIRMVQGVRHHLFEDREAVPFYRCMGFRLAIRCGLVAMILMLLGVRRLNVRYFSQATWSGKTLSTVSQVFLREPRPDTLASLPATIGPDERTFAVAHQLTKACVGMVLWMCVMIFAAFLLLDIWRWRYDLNPSS